MSTQSPPAPFHAAHSHWGRSLLGWQPTLVQQHPVPFRIQTKLPRAIISQGHKVKPGILLNGGNHCGKQWWGSARMPGFPVAFLWHRNHRIVNSSYWRHYVLMRPASRTAKACAAPMCERLFSSLPSLYTYT